MSACATNYGKADVWVSAGFVFTGIDENRLSNRKSDRKNRVRKERDSPAPAASPSLSSPDSYNRTGQVLEPGFLQLGLTQHINQPTHLRSNGIGSTLDLILCSYPLMVSNVECLPPLRWSDPCVLKANGYPITQIADTRVNIRLHH